MQHNSVILTFPSVTSQKGKKITIRSKIKEELLFDFRAYSMEFVGIQMNLTFGLLNVY